VHAIKAYRGGEVQLHSFLPSVLDGSEWSASRCSRFTPENKPPVPIQQAGWAPGPAWTFWRKENYLVPAGNRTTIPRLSRPSPVTIPTEPLLPQTRPRPFQFTGQWPSCRLLPVCTSDGATATKNGLLHFILRTPRMSLC
jgi:hypothetical protein